jgi:ribonuclease VapC
MGPRVKNPPAAVLDTSAILAVLASQDTDGRLQEAMSSMALWISAGTLAEAYVVVQKKWGRNGRDLLDSLLWPMGVQVRVLGLEDVNAHADAYLAWGKGMGTAGLNYGDCFSYAAASLTGLPVLCTGNDFTKTDISTVEW